MQWKDGCILWLKYDSEQSFVAAGHLAILVHTNQKGTKEFLARVPSRRWDDYLYTTVSEGASSVTFRDEGGELVRSDAFEVMVLRYDPEDILPFCEPVPEDALDVTGPFYWTKHDDATDCADYRLNGEYSTQ